MNIGNTNTQNTKGWNPQVALIEKIDAIGSANILFGSDWPGINMKDYKEDIRKTMGSNISKQVLKN